MDERHDAILAAYKVFGLEGDEDFDIVRSKFRKVVKAVHPDTASEGDSRELANQLQRMLKAYEVLRMYAPRYEELALTPEEARKGGLRTVTIGDRNAMIRIPPYAKTGNIVVPVGDPTWRVRILVRDHMVDGNEDEGPAERQTREKKQRELAAMQAREDADHSAGMLSAFYDRFVKESPAARFANWIRKGPDKDKDVA